MVFGDLDRPDTVDAAVDGAGNAVGRLLQPRCDS